MEKYIFSIIFRKLCFFSDVLAFKIVLLAGQYDSSIRTRDQIVKKKLLYLVITITVLSLLCACGKRPAPASLESLQKQFDSVLFQNHTITVDDTEWLESANKLGELLSLNGWTKMRNPPLGEKTLLTIHLSEEYEIIVYESYASVYYGYASFGEANTVYYSIPSETAISLSQYLQEANN